MSYLYSLIQAIIGAVAYRNRGGGFVAYGSTQLARSVWAFAIGSIIALHAFQTVPLLPLLTVYLTAFLALLNGHGAHQDLGHDQQRTVDLFTAPFESLVEEANQSDNYYVRAGVDALCLTWIGILRGMITSLPIMYWEPYLAISVVIGFGLMGFSYVLGYLTKWKLPSLTFGPEWGELYTGMFIGLCIGQF